MADNRPPPPFLEPLQQAVLQEVQVRLGYEDAAGRVSERTVHPLGLVAKGRTWYLVADTDAGLRTFRVWRVRSVEPTGDPVRRPPRFDLAAAWEEEVGRMDELRGALRVRARADPEVVRWLRVQFGRQLEVGEAEGDGTVPVVIGFPTTHDDPARELCAYGDRLEVLDPPEVRERLADIGAQLVARYVS